MRLMSKLKQAIRGAYQLSANYEHEYVTLNHLLLSLIDYTSVKNLLEDSGVNIDSFYRQLVSFTNEVTPKISKDHPQSFAIPTVGFSRIFHQAHFEAKKRGRSYVRGVDVLSAMFSEFDCHCIALLVQEGLNRFSATELLSNNYYAQDEYAA